MTLMYIITILTMFLVTAIIAFIVYLDRIVFSLTQYYLAKVNQNIQFYRSEYAIFQELPWIADFLEKAEDDSISLEELKQRYSNTPEIFTLEAQVNYIEQDEQASKNKDNKHVTIKLVNPHSGNWEMLYEYTCKLLHDFDRVSEAMRMVRGFFGLPYDYQKEEYIEKKIRQAIGIIKKHKEEQIIYI